MKGSSSQLNQEVGKADSKSSEFLKERWGWAIDAEYGLLYYLWFQISSGVPKTCAPQIR